MAINQKLKDILVYILKLALAAGIISYLLTKNFDTLKSAFDTFDMRWLAPAMLTYFAHMFVCAWRWKKLSNILGVELSAKEAFFITMEGYFFSLVMPGGAIGGDVIKMGILSKRSPQGEKFEGAFTVLMDRIIGMIALFVLALLLLYPGAEILNQIELGRFSGKFITPAVAILCVLGLAASCVIFFHKILEKSDWIKKLLAWGNKISHGLENRLVTATDTYAKSWRNLSILTIVSIFGIHIMTVLPMYFLLTGLGLDYSITAVLVAVTIGNIIGLLPLFPAGVGGRDVTIIAIFTASGIAKTNATTAQLLYTAILLFFNLAGGIFFVLDNGRKNIGQK